MKEVIILVTPQNTIWEIQRALDEGGEVVFAPGLYQNAHYRIARPVRLKGEGAVLAGGERIRWTERDGVLAAPVRAEAPLRSLVVNGSLRTRCRLPRTGYWQHESVFDVKWMSTTGGGWQRKPTHEELTTLRAAPGALKGLTLDSAEATVVHSWDESLLTVQRVEGDLIRFAQPGGHPAGGFQVRDYCLWNVPEAFTEKGTFYHDVPAGMLYYRPLDGEGVETEAFLPRFESIFYTDSPVSHVEMEGFSLIATDTPHVPAGFGAYRMPGAIDLRDVSDSAIHHVRITAVGGYGIRSQGRFERNRIHHCVVSGTGAGGIRAGEETSPANYSEIADCRIDHVGLYYASAIGLSSVCCHIRHNEIFHTSYSAVNCAGDGIVVEKNLLHDAMEVLNDGAAIYSFGAREGVLRGNMAFGIHPKNGHRLRSAYYLDELSRDWLVEKNVAVDCDVPNHNHMCGGHTYRENLFVNQSADLRITLQNCPWGCRYVDNVFSSGGTITFSGTQAALERIAGNRFHAADGVIHCDVLDRYEKIAERVCPEEDNERMDALRCSGEQRVFRAPGLQIDLTDVGPRGALPGEGEPFAR